MSAKSKASATESQPVLSISGYLDKLTPINRQYHLRQCVESNLPNDTDSIVIESLMNCLCAEIGSKKHLTACQIVIDGIRDTGSDIVFTTVKNSWRDADGLVVNEPALKVTESIDYITRFTVSRKNLLAYASNPFSSRIGVFDIEPLFTSEKSRNKTTKVTHKV